MWNAIKDWFNRIHWYQIGYFLVTALLICGPAFFNRFPLIYFDSGAYIGGAFTFDPAFDRPIGYGLFILLTGFLKTFWTTLIAQGFIMSYLIFRVIAIIFPTRSPYLIHFPTVVLLTLFSGLSWYTAQLMPDFLTSALIMAAFVFIRSNGRNLVELILLWLLVVIAIMSHFSHTAIAMLLLFSLGLIFFLKKSWMLNQLRVIKRLAFLSMAVLAGVLFIMTHHASNDLGFRYSLSSNVFLVANLCETGLLQPYLEEKCENNQLSLCQFKDSLPTNTDGFLWDPEGPFRKPAMGWDRTNAEYGVIVRDFFTTPKHIGSFIGMSMESTLKQLFQVNIGSGLHSFKENSPPFYALRRHAPGELNSFLNSVQAKQGFDFQFLNWINYLLLGLSLIALFVLGYFRWANLEFQLFCTICFLGIFFNAFVTGTLANVYERLQARVSWLIVFIGLLALVVLLEKGIAFLQRPNGSEKEPPN